MKAVRKNQGQVLIDLLRSLDRNDLKIAELGVWKSHTVKRVLRSCGDIISQYWAIDFWQFTNHWTYRHIPTERWQQLYFHACRLMRWFPQLNVVRMLSTEASKLFPEQYFDLVFIDANHVYEFVLNDIKDWLPLIKDGGLLTGHDYGGKKVGVKQAVDECFDDVEIYDAGVWVKKK